MSIKSELKKTYLYILFDVIRSKTRIVREALGMVWQRLCLAVPCKHFRRTFLNCHKDVHIGKNSPIYSGFEWWKGPFKVGDNCNIGFHNHIDCRRGVTIGNNVTLATGVMMWSLHHDYNDINFKVVGGGHFNR